MAGSNKFRELGLRFVTDHHKRHFLFSSFLTTFHFREGPGVYTLEFIEAKFVEYLNLQDAQVSQ